MSCHQPPHQNCFYVATIFNQCRFFSYEIISLLTTNTAHTNAKHKLRTADVIVCYTFLYDMIRGELSYLAPLGSENISAPYFKQCFFRGGGITPQTESNTTPPRSKTEITNILFYILNFSSIIKFKMKLSLTFYHNKKQK